MFVCIYVAAGSVCRLNVPENTRIHVAQVHIGNVHCCTIDDTQNTGQRMSTKSSTATKKLGQLLAQRFKLACCVDRVSAVYYTACSYAVGSVYDRLTTRII